MNGSPAAGSHAWQMAFVSFAVVLILFQMLRGWSLGLPRQIVRLCAIVAAYGAAFLGGRMMLPFVRPLVRLPDVALSAIGGALLAMIVYAVINGVGALLFKRTAQQESGFIRMIYGASGAFLGLFFGLFFVWLLITGVRSVGSVADAQVQVKTPASLPPNARRIVNGRLLPAADMDAHSLTELLARLKNSVEMGGLGEVIKRTDPLPSGSLKTVERVGETFAKAETAERFLSSPGARELAMHPRIVELRQDPHIARMISEGRVLDLLQDQRVIDAMNDPSLVERIKHFDLQRALEYANEQPPQ
ncbi:MAG: CvpA family protein [Chthoniobacterales bacterium]